MRYFTIPRNLIPVSLLRRAVIVGWLVLGQWLSAAPEFVLGPPPGDGPVEVKAAFYLRSINSIDDEAESFEFAGTLVLTWQDPRQAFDPAQAGVREKIYQGDNQTYDVNPAWFPQLVLANECGMSLSNTSALRVHPDGTSVLTTMINASAKTNLSMRRYPFDTQRLQAVFEIPAFQLNEVTIKVEQATANVDLSIDQWHLKGMEAAAPGPEPHPASAMSAPPTFVVTAVVERDPFFILRLVGLPLALIVVLSWSVFWMDRSSLGDRLSVSFIGILTAVAYQIVVGDLLPHVSYVTLMHAFLNFSFILMCASVVINLVVASCDKNGKEEVGDLIDCRCRILFPLIYFGSILFAVVVVFTLF